MPRQQVLLRTTKKTTKTAQVSVSVQLIYFPVSSLSWMEFELFKPSCWEQQVSFSVLGICVHVTNKSQLELKTIDCQETWDVLIIIKMFIITAYSTVIIHRSIHPYENKSRVVALQLKNTNVCLHDHMCMYIYIYACLCIKHVLYTGFCPGFYSIKPGAFHLFVCGENQNG